MVGSGSPLWPLGCCAVVAAILTAAGCIWLGKRTVRSVDDHHNQSMAPSITVVGLVNGVLLGVTVVIAWPQYSSAGAIVAEEASTHVIVSSTIALPLRLLMLNAFALDHPYGVERGIAAAPFRHALGGFRLGGPGDVISSRS